MTTGETSAEKFGCLNLGNQRRQINFHIIGLARRRDRHHAGFLAEIGLEYSGKALGLLRCGRGGQRWRAGRNKTNEREED